MANTVASFFTFVASTKARAEQVNNNFDVFRGNLINVDASVAASDSTFTYGLGIASKRWGNSFIEKINFGRTTSGWQIKDSTTTTADLEFQNNSINIFKFKPDFSLHFADTYGMSMIPTTTGAIIIQNSGASADILGAPFRDTVTTTHIGGFAISGVISSNISASGATTHANSTLTMASNGRPVMLNLIPSTETNNTSSSIEVFSATTAIAAVGKINLIRNGSTVSSAEISFDVSSDNSKNIKVPANLTFLDFGAGAASAVVYFLESPFSVAGGFTHIRSCRLMAREL